MASQPLVRGDPRRYRGQPVDQRDFADSGDSFESSDTRFDFGATTNLRQIIKRAAGIFVPAITAVAHVPMSLGDGGFLGCAFNFPKVMQRFWNFNVGHLITILGGIGSLLVVNAKLQAKVDSLSARMIQQERSSAELQRTGLLTTVAEHERRLINLENVANDFREVRTDVRWIKENLYKKQ